VRGPRGGDLERVALADLGQVVRDLLAQRERDPVGMVDVEADRVAHDLREQQFDLGLSRGEPLLDLFLDGLCAHWRDPPL
jgi:hypothetical protein